MNKIFPSLLNLSALEGTKNTAILAIFRTSALRYTQSISIHPHFNYGELRLSRLNKIYAFSQTLLRGYMRHWIQYGKVRVRVELRPG